MPHGVCSALGDCICQPDFAGATCGSARNTSVFVLPWDTNVMQWAVLYVPFKVRRRMASGSWSERVTVASPTPTHLPPTRAALHTLHPPVLLISPFHFGFAQSDMTMDFVIVFLMMLQLTAFETMRAVESERRAEIERNRGCVHRLNRVLIALRVCEEVRARALVYVCVRGGGFNTTLTSSPSTNYTPPPLSGRLTRRWLSTCSRARACQSASPRGRGRPAPAPWTTGRNTRAPSSTRSSSWFANEWQWVGGWVGGSKVPGVAGGGVVVADQTRCLFL